MGFLHGALLTTVIARARCAATRCSPSCRERRQSRTGPFCPARLGAFGGALASERQAAAMRRDPVPSRPWPESTDARRLWGGYHLWRAVADAAAGRPNWAAYQTLRGAGFRKRSGRG